MQWRSGCNATPRGARAPRPGPGARPTATAGWRYRSSARDQVDDGEDHDPHHVDEVPVEAYELDGLRVLGPELPPQRQPEQREQHHDGDGHVGAVEAGENEEAAAEEVGVQSEALAHE